MMKLPRRQFLHLAAGAAALLAIPRTAWAYPTRPVTLIVFLPAGATPDIICKTADGLLLSVEEQSCSGHQCNDGIP
jgi:tripartite-type tricarboxylate transporter receptor subunit TctC